MSELRSVRARSMILHLARAIPRAANWLRTNQRRPGYQAQSDWLLFGGTILWLSDGQHPNERDNTSWLHLILLFRTMHSGV